MNLFLDILSPKNTLILFDNNKNIKNIYFFDVKLQESTKLIEELDNFLKLNNTKYSDLENIVVVSWPGSFTWLRTTILLVNTINFVIKKNISTLTYFDLFDSFPIIKTSSKRDSFLKMSQNNEIQILTNLEIEKLLLKKNIKKIFGDADFLKNRKIIKTPNYKNIIKNLKFQKNKIVSPFYIKKPNIS